jgi:uncharacterized protein
MESESTQVIYSSKPSDALVAYLIKKYKEVSDRTLGRTILQKLCYFAESSGVPLPFRFEMYHYGPFSQEIFETTENLVLDKAIEDKSVSGGQSNYVPGANCDFLLRRFNAEVSEYKESLDRVAKMFSQLDPSQMELVATIHYVHSSHAQWFKDPPTKQGVVESVLKVKGQKFSRGFVEHVYDVVRDANLL